MVEVGGGLTCRIQRGGCDMYLLVAFVGLHAAIAIVIRIATLATILDLRWGVILRYSNRFAMWS